MTLPTGHGRCLTHQHYDLDCDDFERLRARAADRCEMPGCGAAGPDTKSGILYIDHHGPLGPDARVRGLLCCRCNTAIGRAESRPGSRFCRPATVAELAYLTRAFWREPESVAVQERKDAERERRRMLVKELAKPPHRRTILAGMSDDDAIGRALDEGVRQADILRGTRHTAHKVTMAAKRWRQRAA